MRILVLGAGGVGGFWGRLVEKEKMLLFLFVVNGKTIGGKRTCNPQC